MGTCSSSTTTSPETKPYTKAQLLSDLLKRYSDGYYAHCTEDDVVSSYRRFADPEKSVLSEKQYHNLTVFIEAELLTKSSNDLVRSTQAKVQMLSSSPRLKTARIASPYQTTRTLGFSPTRSGRSIVPTFEQGLEPSTEQIVSASRASTHTGGDLVARSESDESHVPQRLLGVSRFLSNEQQAATAQFDLAKRLQRSGKQQADGRTLF